VEKEKEEEEENYFIQAFHWHSGFSCCQIFT